MSLEKPSNKHIIFVQTLNLIGCHGNRKAKIENNIFKNIFNSSDTKRGIKLNVGRNVHNISLYNNGTFIAVAYVLPLLWQLLSFHWFLIGNV